MEKMELMEKMGKNERLPRSTPEAQGVRALDILNFLAKVKEDGHELHSFMLVKNGRVISEAWWKPYGPRFRHTLFSLSKSFTSMAVGIAVDEGKLTTEMLVTDIFKKEVEELKGRIDDRMRRMTVRHLLTMSAGQGYEPWAENSIKSFLSAHFKHEPGETFFYNTLATYMLSAAVQRQTGENLEAYLRPRLFDPLGIDPWWEADNQGISCGGFGLNVRTEGIAAFGQFLLQKGLWQGKRLVSEAWIEAATSKQISNGADDSDWGRGYGYQFWRCEPAGVYRGDGAYGQFCIVMPNEESVIAITSNVDMGKLLKLIWSMLWPALGNASPLSADASGVEKLREHCANLSHLTTEAGDAYPCFRGLYKSPVPAEEQGQAGIDALVVDFEGNEAIITAYRDFSRMTVSDVMRCLNGEWTFGAAAHPSGRPYNRVCFYGHWRDDTFTATRWYYETHEKQVVIFRFSPDRSELEMSYGGSDGQIIKFVKG